MGATLRVDPERLRSAARAQAEVDTFVSGMAVGQSLATAGGGVSGLTSEAACRFAGSLFDNASTAVHDELTAHTSNLSAAADQYLRMDEGLGSGLRMFVE